MLVILADDCLERLLGYTHLMGNTLQLVLCRLVTESGGFFAKLNVISAVLNVGGTGLAVLMVLASVVGAYYYLRVIWYMYFEAGEDKAVLQARTDTRFVLSLNGVAVLALGIVPGWLLALCIQVIA